jgi:hypothetical protein
MIDFDDINISKKKAIYLFHFKLNISVEESMEEFESTTACVNVKSFGNKIFLNLKRIFDRYEAFNRYYDRKYTFEQKLCESITHESMHLLINETNGIYAYHQYDNITCNLRIDGYMV